MEPIATHLQKSWPFSKCVPGPLSPSGAASESGQLFAVDELRFVTVNVPPVTSSMPSEFVLALPISTGSRDLQQTFPICIPQHGRLKPVGYGDGEPVSDRAGKDDPVPT